MLIEFSVENFLSFNKKNTFTMNASSDKDLISNYVTDDNYKILKTTAIYGANASGKTNLFKSLTFLVNLVKNSNMLLPDYPILRTPFKLLPNAYKKPTKFELKLLINGIKYVYSVSFNDMKILDESLIYYPHGHPAKIFTREKTNIYEFNNEDKRVLDEIKEKNTENKLFLATATTWNYAKTKPVFDLLNEKIISIYNIDNVNNIALEKYYNDKDKKLENIALDFLRKADVNIDGFSIEIDKLSEERFDALPEEVKKKIGYRFLTYHVNTKHKALDFEVDFNLREESLGTRTVFLLIPIIKDVIDNQKIILFDELDRSLHPFLVKYIVNIFNDATLNPKGAQLIFNTHDTNLLDRNIFRRDQIWFTEKNYKSGESEIYPLDDFEVRKAENIQKGYLIGRYGAIPFLENNIDILKEDLW